jgi:hypothetical protein
MRPARTIAAVILATVAVAGCSVHTGTAHPAASAPPSSTAPPQTPAPTTTPPPPTSGSSAGQPATAHCQATALRASVAGTEGAAGTIWTTVRLRNVSGGTCTVGGIAQVRLLGADGAPVTAPSVPDGPGGSLIALRPGQAVTFAYGEPNVCDTTVAGSRIRVTLPGGRGSETVGLGALARYGTCALVHVQAMRRAAG